MLKKSRINYWSCSKLANLIRGTKKPFALSFEDWEKWRVEAQNKYPIRYWISEELLNKLQDIVFFPQDLYYTIRVYIRNRWIDKLHYLKTGLKPGEYYDLDHRILCGLFNELVDLVEIEYAHLSRWAKEKKYKFVKGRCVEAGLDYLNWASSLTYDDDYGIDEKDKDKPTTQAVAAKKTLELYNWWKNRDNRPDPYDLFKKQDDSKYYLKIDEMERKYDEEDTEMLISLIKIRSHFWT